MGRKLVLSIIVIGVLGMLGLFAWKYQRKSENIAQIKEQIQFVPNIWLKTFDEEQYSISDFASGRPLLIIYFNSTCGMCKIELNALNERFAEFEQINILLASFQEKRELEGFAEEYPFVSEPNIKLALDEEMHLSAYLGVKSVPSVFCYDSEGILIANYQGPVKLDVLLDKFLNIKGVEK
jgi:peroxiredoxin